MTLVHDAMVINPIDQSLHKEEDALKKDLNIVLAHEESRYRQTSRENWLNLGDRNSKFFHASIKSGQALNNLNHLLKSDIAPMTDIEQIQQQAPLFFQNLFTQDSYCNSFSDIIVKKKLTEKAKHWLIRNVGHVWLS